MGNLNKFDANEVEPTESFDPIPAGKYKAIITESEMKPTKAGTGEYLSLRLDIIDGEYEGRVIFDILNLDNPNDEAVRIARKQLSAICRAVSVMTPEDSSDLHDKPMIIKVGIRPASNGYDASNSVKAYEAIGGNAAPAQVIKKETVAAAAAKTSRKPWE